MWNPLVCDVLLATIPLSRFGEYQLYEMLLFASYVNRLVLSFVLFFCFWLIDIREYGSTLYVGLARAVSPTNTNFQCSL